MSQKLSSYSWVVHYNDGVSVPQYEPDGTENKYIHIDRARVASFDVVKTDTQCVVLSVHLDPDARWIWRRRVFLNPITGETVFYLAGWQKTVAGSNVQLISVIEEGTGRIHMIGRWREDHPVFYPIELIEGVEYEKEHV